MAANQDRTARPVATSPMGVEAAAAARVVIRAALPAIGIRSAEIAMLGVPVTATAIATMAEIQDSPVTDGTMAEITAVDSGIGLTP